MKVHVNEEELDKLAEKAFPDTYEFGEYERITHKISKIVERKAFKAGYCKANDYMEQVLQNITDYINSKNAFEYSILSSDIPISGKVRYEKSVELESKLNEITEQLKSLGYKIYTYE